VPVDIRVTVGSIPPLFPDETNTGVPASVELTSHDGNVETTEAGQLIEALDINGSVVVKHPGVVIRNCRITGWQFFGIVTESGAATGDPLLVDHCTISDPSVLGGSTAITEFNFTAKSCNIFNVENGFDVSADVLIQDCYVHDLFNGDGDPHSDCIQTSTGVDISNVTIRHNRLYCFGGGVGGTSCIICAIGSLSFTDILIENNLMAGGSFALYGPQSTTGDNVQIVDNKFSTIFFETVGAFGPWTDATDEAAVSGNVIFETGESIP
jgi:hypothetical protein